MEAPHANAQRHEYRHNSGSVRSGGSRSPKPVVHFTYSSSNQMIPPPTHTPPQSQQHLHQSQHSFHSHSQKIIEKPQSQPPQIYTYGPPPMQMQYRQEPPPPPPPQQVFNKTTSISWEHHYLTVV